MSENRPPGRPSQAVRKDAIVQHLEMTAKKIKFRRYVVAGAFTLVTVAGAWFGASLKTERDLRKEKKKVYEASDEEVIEYLTDLRKKHERTKVELEKKLDGLRARMAEKVRKEAEGRGEQ